nr:YitT family protein [Tissierella sp.]
MYSEKNESKDWSLFIKRLLFIFLANILCTLAFNGFLVPAKLLSGGVGGLAIMIQYLTGISSGIIVFVINIPIFLVGAKMVDKDFAIYGFISMIMFSILLTLTDGIAKYILIEDVVLRAIFGGVINGAGMGLLFRNRSSQGGLDIVAAVLKRKYNMNIGSALMMLNSVIIAMASILFGLDKGLYTLLSMYIAYQVLDKVQIGFSNKKNIVIVSDKPEEIAQEILVSLKRGVTYLDGMGAYSKENKHIIYCIIISKEVVTVKNIIDKIDPTAFLIITDVVEVKGSGFKQIGI